MGRNLNQEGTGHQETRPREGKLTPGLPVPALESPASWSGCSRLAGPGVWPRACGEDPDITGRRPRLRTRRRAGPPRVPGGFRSKRGEKIYQVHGYLQQGPARQGLLSTYTTVLGTKVSRGDRCDAALWRRVTGTRAGDKYHRGPYTSNSVSQGSQNRPEAVQLDKTPGQSRDRETAFEGAGATRARKDCLEPRRKRPPARDHVAMEQSSQESNARKQGEGNQSTTSSWPVKHPCKQVSALISLHLRA